MFTFKHLIVGGGMTADSAVQGIREIDKDGNIGLISMEKDKPYDRPHGNSHPSEIQQGV